MSSHRLALLAACAAALAAVAPRAARASIQSLPDTLVPDVLSETVPMAFAPAGFEAADFALEWEGQALPGVKVALGEKSLEWVRVAEILVLPRARLVLEAQGAQGGQVRSGGFTQNLAVKDGIGRAELPVALVSGSRNPIDVAIVRGGRKLAGRLLVRFRPRGRDDRESPRIFSDPSCSPYGLSAKIAWGKLANRWVYIGCRLVYAEGSEHRTSSLEAFVYFDGAGSELSIGGVPTPPTSASVWGLRLRSGGEPVELASGPDAIKLDYAVPEYLHKLSIGLGVGPYSYSYDAPGVNASTVAALGTIYASYFVNETMRVVAFDALALHSAYFNDLGLYFNSESFRVLDRRLSLNVMLGAHFLVFRTSGEARESFSPPQGVELIFRDFLGKGLNLSVGGFIYPPINGKSYYNTWLRWGSYACFGELNYIAWQEPLDEARAASRSLGLSIGFPFLRLF